MGEVSEFERRVELAGDMVFFLISLGVMVALVYFGVQSIRRSADRLAAAELAALEACQADPACTITTARFERMCELHERLQ